MEETRIVTRKELATEVKAARKARGWSQSQLASHAGVEAWAVAQLETARPVGEKAPKIAEALELDPFLFAQPTNPIAAAAIEDGD
jgi:transcriptional regulator with XRE-family HTH domain